MNTTTVNRNTSVVEPKQAQIAQVKSGEAKSDVKKADIKKVENDDQDFSAELTLAGAAAAQQAQKPATAAAQTAQATLVTPEAPKSAKASVSDVALTPPIQQRSSVGTDSAEKNPLTQTKAASLNTGVSIAGLKPWNKDWVFDGQDGNPELKGILSSATDKPDQAQAAQVLKKAAAALPTQASSKEAMLALQALARGDETQPAMVLNAKALKQIAAAINGQEPQLTTPSENVSPMPKQVPGAEPMIQIDPQLAAQIKALGGNVDELQIALGNLAQASTPQEVRPVQKQISSPIHNVSGAEFLSTLGAMQSSAMGAKNGSSLGDGQGESQSGNKNGEQLSLGQKPNLRVIEGGLKSKRPQLEDELVSSKLGKGNLGAHAGASLNSPNVEVKAPTLSEVAGHVVKGAMSQDRLSSESILSVSSGIKNLAQSGGGEMRIRLKPDNLGELHLRVVTDGTQVGLHIQASDERAKKVLEESIGHLKEGLASQNLSLGKLDVTVAQAVQNSDAQMRQDSNSQNPNQAWSGDWASQNQSNRENSEGRQNRYLSGDDASSKASVAMAQARAQSMMGRNSSAAAASGRLDVTA